MYTTAVSTSLLPRTNPHWVIPLWIVGASIALIQGAIWSSRLGGHRLFVTWWPTQDPTSVPARVALLVPIFLAVTSLVTLRVRARLLRATVLTILTLAALTVYLAVALIAEQDTEAFVLLIQIVVGAALVAAGNRGMRLFPDRKAPRILSGIGGVGLLLAFLGTDSGSFRSCLLHDVLGEGMFGHRQEVPALFAGLLLLYAVLGAVSPFARPSATLQFRMMSLFKYVLMFTFPIALYRQWVASCAWCGEDERAREMMFLLRFWLLGTGHTVLLAAGISSWIEESADIEKRSVEPVLPRPSG